MSIKSEISDAICNILEDLYYDQRISQLERDSWYLVLGHQLRLPDLITDQSVRIVSILKPPPAQGDIPMAAKAIIVGKNQDKSIPDAYLDKVLTEMAEDHQALGIAYAENGVVGFAMAEELPSVEGFQEVMENFKAQSIFYFAASPTEILTEDRQPFSLIEDDAGKPTLMVFLEGTFPNYEQGDNAHMPEHFVFNDYLLEKLQEIYDKHDGDLDKICTELDSPTFRKDVRNLFIPRGVITLIAGNGKIITIAKNELVGSYPWGWTSNKLDYTEKGAEVIDKKTLATMSLTDKLKASLTSKPVAKEPDKTATKIPAGAGEEKIAIPTQLNHKGRKKWMNRNLINRPADWETIKEVSAAMLKPGSALRMSLKSFQQLTQEEVSAAKADAEERRAEQALLIPQGQRKTLLDKFTSQLKEDSKQLITKEKIDQLEDNYPTFTEQTDDYPLQLVLHWPVDRFEALVKECPSGAVSLINDLRYALLEAKPELLRETPKKSVPSVERKRM